MRQPTNVPIPPTIKRAVVAAAAAAKQVRTFVCRPSLSVYTVMIGFVIVFSDALFVRRLLARPLDSWLVGWLVGCLSATYGDAMSNHFQNGGRWRKEEDGEMVRGSRQNAWVGWMDGWMDGMDDQPNK